MAFHSIERDGLLYICLHSQSVPDVSWHFVLYSWSLPFGGQIWQAEDACAMRKVLWLSNYRFSEESNRGSGAWIEAMGKGLLHSGKYELYNVTCANVCEVCRCDACGVNQWGIPIKRIMGRPLDAMPPHDMLDAIVRIVDGIKPDLIHVW